MATVTSHLLDSVSGGSAVGVRVNLTRIDPNGNRTKVFSCETDQEGRVNQTVAPGSDENARFELEFQTADYFRAQHNLAADDAIMDSVIIRIRMSDAEKRYHFPVMASPHSYSLWWSR